ncbi:MAG: hypothetical protein HYX20_03280 [Candidatus Yanofskybacteria bacterium]|nr:hypothetical protein [Candidatus Yanofskybacteria bacterium]
MNYKNITPAVFAASFTVLGLVIGIVSVLFLTNFLKYDHYNRQDFIDPNAYQAVFLTNDQTYFGHLKDIKPDYLLLADVYYVRVSEGGNQIVRLGGIEPHGPENAMVISKSQVLLWENLKPDSQVIRAIQNIPPK